MLGGQGAGKAPPQVRPKQNVNKNQNQKKQERTKKNKKREGWGEERWATTLSSLAPKRLGRKIREAKIRLPAETEKPKKHGFHRPRKKQTGRSKPKERERRAGGNQQRPQKPKEPRHPPTPRRRQVVQCAPLPQGSHRTQASDGQLFREPGAGQSKPPPKK